MRKFSVLPSGASLCTLVVHTVFSQAAQGPLLQIETVPNQQLQLSWTSPTADFLVERTASILPSSLWQALAQTPTRQGDLAVGGQKGTLNSLQVDGADNNNTFFGQSFGRTGTRPAVRCTRRTRRTWTPCAGRSATGAARS